MGHSQLCLGYLVILPLGGMWTLFSRAGIRLGISLRTLVDKDCLYMNRHRASIGKKGKSGSQKRSRGGKERRGRQRRIKGSCISASEGTSDVGLRKRGKTGSTCVRKVTAEIPLVLLADPVTLSSVQFSCSVVSDSLWPYGLQHTRPPCPSPAARVYSNSCSLGWWCHPTISSSVIGQLSVRPGARALQDPMMVVTVL